MIFQQIDATKQSLNCHFAWGKKITLDKALQSLFAPRNHNTCRDMQIGNFRYWRSPKTKVKKGKSLLFLYSLWDKVLSGAAHSGFCFVFLVLFIFCVWWCCLVFTIAAKNKKNKKRELQTMKTLRTYYCFVECTCTTSYTVSICWFVFHPHSCSTACLSVGR